MRIDAGAADDLEKHGYLLTKAGSHGVCVFWDDGCAYALDDRCPHMGFPLHRGTVDHGLVTCHWHHARFALASGGTLDPFADDVRAYPVEISDRRVFVVVEPDGDRVPHLQHRLTEGLEQGLTLIVAKAVLGLLEAGATPSDIVTTGLDFGTAYRREGWGAGLTVLTAMANLLPHLAPDDRPLALVHGLAFVSRDTRNRPPRFPLTPLGAATPRDRLTSWYRRSIETRSEDGAERVLLTALGDEMPPAEVGAMMLAAATDHVFLDGGHTVDFTNKAFEALDHVGWQRAPDVLPTLLFQTARASRAEDGGQWRHPHDLVGLLRDADDRLPALLAAADGAEGGFNDLRGVAEWVLADDPREVVGAVTDALAAGATLEQVGRAIALAAALRITRFHTQNDFGDWDVVHHGFTYANSIHAMLGRVPPSAEAARGLLHGALRVYLDRFLNVPAARLPAVPDATPDLGELQECWDSQGRVDEAGGIAYGYLRAGGDPAHLIAALARALLVEDAQFHWFQTVEAAIRQFHAWPRGCEEGALILAGTARFLAAHTPTRRELSHVVRTATRLRRGEELFEES